MILFFPAKEGEVLRSQQKQDWELTVAQLMNSLLLSSDLNTKFRIKLKKVGKTTRPFRHDLNQILYDYRLEVRNRLQGLDLRDRVPEELWTEVCDIVQEAGIKTTPKKKKCKKGKWLSEEGGLHSCKKKRSKKQRRKGKIYPFECKVPKSSKER